MKNVSLKDCLIIVGLIALTFYIPDQAELVIGGLLGFLGLKRKIKEPSGDK